MDNTVGIEYIVLNSPSKRILEETILKTDFDCIIPLQAINKGNNTYNKSIRFLWSEVFW